MASPTVAHLLLVEDDGDLLQVLQFLLEDERYEVSTAQDGASALAIARAKAPDLVLLDITLHDISGIEVAKSLRADPATAGILIVMHSGLEEASVRRQFSGYDLFIPKAEDPAEVLNRIATVLAQPRASAARAVAAQPAV